MIGPGDEGVSLVLERRMRAPLGVVFAMLSDADELSGWLGPRGCTDTQFVGDVREGRAFVFRMQWGKGRYAAEGVFREVVRDVRVAFTWRWIEAPPGEPLDTRETLVTLAVRAEGEFTILTLTHAQLPDEASAEKHKSGWADGLDRLVDRVRKGART
jgi:uncharacterized protein YndB with AHSA1/START domain